MARARARGLRPASTVGALSSRKPAEACAWVTPVRAAICRAAFAGTFTCSGAGSWPANACMSSQGVMPAIGVAPKESV